MIAKGKRKDNGKWITGYPLTYGFEDKWYFVPESINELEIVPVEKKTICRYTGEMLSDGRRLHEFDKVEVKDADGNKILGIIRLVHIRTVQPQLISVFMWIGRTTYIGEMILDTG